MTDIDDQKQLYVKCSDPNVVCDSKPTVSTIMTLIYLYAIVINRVYPLIVYSYKMFYVIILCFYFDHENWNLADVVIVAVVAPVVVG